MYKLLIVDDEPLVQVGIRSMIDWQQLNIEIVGNAGNGQIALNMINEHNPDIVLCDIKMPVMDGLELLKNVREKYGSFRPVFIMLTSYEDFHYVRESMAQKAFLYLLKLELSPESLEDSITKAIAYIEETMPSTTANSASAQSNTLYSYKEKFLISLLNNLFENENQMHLQAESLRLTFSSQGYLCCFGAIRISNVLNLSKSEELTLRNNSINMLNELLSKQYTHYTISLDFAHFAIIFCLPQETDHDLITEKIADSLKRISTSLANYYNVTLFCGLGTYVTSPMELSSSFQHSRITFRFADSANNIASFNDEKQLPHDAFNMSIFSADLTRAFEDYSSDLLTSVIGTISGLLSEHQHHYVQAVDAASSILYMAISLLPNGEQELSELYKDVPEGYRSLYQQSSVSMVVKWLDAFCAKLCTLFDEKRKDYKNRIVLDVKNYVLENIGTKLSLNEVAANFGISPSYLSQLFSKYNDTGFNEFITIAKINSAKTMLKEENMKIYEVAEALGFGSEFYFSKVFKKIEGISPSEYLNKR